MNAKVRYSIASVAAAVEAMILVTVTARGAGASLPAAATFPYTGSNQQYTVPAGVCGVRIQVEGAAGGSNYYAEPGGHGGTGSGEFVVQPNDVLTVVVGGRGSYTPDYNQTWFPGGFGGGGQQSDHSSGGGGGATTVLSGVTPLLVAGGGGGRSMKQSTLSNGTPGNGGDAGSPGTRGTDGHFIGGSIGPGGSGGTLVAGGVANGFGANPGVSGLGGNGIGVNLGSSGAGGGGFFGGAGGGGGSLYGQSGGSGGGGSGFVASGATNVGTWAAHTGTADGSAAITPTTECQVATTTSTTTTTAAPQSSTTILGTDPNALVPAFTG
jgi:hypothetical protein